MMMSPLAANNGRVKVMIMRVQSYSSILIVVLLVGSVWADDKELNQKRDTPSSINDVVPKTVLHLSAWPEAEKLTPWKVSEKKESDATSEESRRRVHEKKVLVEWTNRVLAKSWLPPRDTDIFVTPNEVDRGDVTRMTWESHGYTLEVATGGVMFVMRITPVNKKDRMGEDSTEKLNIARDLCLSMFRDKSDQGTPPVEHLARRIASASFDKSTVINVDNEIVIGRPKTRAQEGVQSPETEEQRIKEQSPDNPNWFNSYDAWSYWFRNVCWWNDGKSVVVYFKMKMAGSLYEYE